MRFRLDHHNKILTILESLNSDILKEGSAYFGGGTLLALDFEEYRWSKDIDFISPVGVSGYKYLRTVVFDGGYEALFTDLSGIHIGRGTTDQYGIRMIVIVDNLPIKTEIIAESRFQPDPPRYTEWSPVPCLSLIDCFTSKLLANSDRYMDDSVESRDLIDLAILRLQSPIPEAAINKAENAYEVIRPLKTAVKRFQERPDYREKCFLSLQIDETQIPKIIDGIDLIATDFNLETTQRVFKEQHDIFMDLDKQQ
ncbi:nucleotidyl transferase AbiEii/AbiGii toxin family protein [Nostoc spongiaeforme FACHB-130]|uniref:Nucleotidyl transferase AbiEii/AbiGii toxin family protein n=1 Tax=Nostoc spongiaeforme FACHB-130 TaxID=1357510 RepID=A0ABR8G1N5_9NOSO|nr:nucleotidyl transferase AbiEii/AbiGii toxin family protein [Nostoc spongiaeforme]MBD2597151.1 nucleotidyl transferase AbiEii/AbiGii toxin family protein [Nostoc spongiaeforme FACHB-130]